MEEERSGGGDSEESDLGAKSKKKRKINRQNERKRVTLPRSDHLWSRSPTHGCEGRPRGPEQGGKRVSRVWRWRLGFVFGTRKRKGKLFFFVEVPLNIETVILYVVKLKNNNPFYP